MDIYSDRVVALNCKCIPLLQHLTNAYLSMCYWKIEKMSFYISTLKKHKPDE